MCFDAQKMFQDAALLQLTTTCWTTDKKLPSCYLSAIGNSDFLKGRKMLLPKEDTENIKATIGLARNYLRSMALPFPLRGVVLIPKQLISTVQEKLSGLQWTFYSHVEDFITNFDATVDEAKIRLGELFDETEYPSKDDLRKKFKFEWRYLTVGPSTTRILPPAIYQEEVNKFKQLMEDARLEAIDALRTEFTELISNLTDKLNGTDDGKIKRLRDAAVDNLKAFLDTFSQRNIFSDGELDTLVQQCRGIIDTDVTAESIRKNINIKHELHAKMSELVTALDSHLTPLPKRKLRLDNVTSDMAAEMRDVA